MKKSRSAAVRVALASASALALSAGTPVQAQVHNWTGFYVGGNFGAAWGRSDASTSVPCTAAGLPPGYFCSLAAPANGVAVAASGSGSLSGNGATGGVQAGFNFQNGNFVTGLEADFGAFGIKASRQASANYPLGIGPVSTANTYTVGSSIETEWLFTARGRVGWAFANLLAYATGGLAVTSLKVSHSFSDNHAAGGFPGATANGSASGQKTGWTVGGGAEWALNKNWTVKAEYLYLNFGSVTVSSTITHQGLIGYSQAISTTSDLTAHIARAGINYRF